MVDKIEIAELNIKFIGDTDDLQKGVQKANIVVTASFSNVERASDGVEKSFDKVDQASKRLDTDAVNLAARMQILTQVYDIFKQSVSKGVDLARLGAQAERVEDRFKKFAATIGDADEILAAFNRGSGGSVDSLSAMNQAALLIQQGLVTTNDEMEKTVEMATRLGDQTLSATSRLEFFSQLLKNQSIRLLDNFGISSGRVRTRIEELMDATAGLTREEAFRIATFEEGQKALDILGERVDDHAMKFEKATVRLTEFRIEMGQKLMPVLAQGAEFVSNLDTATLALTGGLSAALGIAVKLTGGLSQLITKLGMTGTQFGVLAVGIGVAIAAYEVYSRILKDVEEAQREANEAIAEWSNEAQLAVGEGIKLDNVIFDLATKTRKLNEDLYEDGNILVDITANLRRATHGTQQMTDAAYKARQIIIQQADSIEEANRLVSIYNERVGDGGRHLKEFTEDVWKNIEAFNVWSSTTTAINAVLGIIGLDVIPDLNQAVAENKRRIEEATRAEEEHAKSIAATSQQMELTTLRMRYRQMEYEREYKQRQMLLDIEKEGRKRAEERAEAQRKAAEEAAEALAKELEAEQALLNAQLRRAEALKDADAERVARAAISELEKAQRAGIISFEDYTKAVVEIQDRFGLADDESRALTLGLGALIDGLATGAIEASKFDEALVLMIEDAKDGVIAFDELVQRVAAMGEEVQGVIRGIRDMSGLGGEGMVYSPLGFARPDLATAGAAPTVTSERIGRTGAGAAPIGGGGLVIYGGVHLEGVEDADDFLRQLMSIME